MSYCNAWSNAKSRVLQVFEKKDRREFIEVLGRLVKVATVNPPGENYSEITGAALELMEKAGLEAEVHEVPRNVVEKHIPEYADYPRYIVFARAGRGRPVLHINGHYDVVPAGDNWTKPPFKLTVEGDTVYGRGVVDMKGGLTAAIIAAEAAVEAGLPEKGTLELSFTPDEETGGETGVAYMLGVGLARPDYAVVAEASGSKSIWIGNKGALWAEIEVLGRQAHASTPWLGANAFEGMVEAARTITDYLKPKLASKTSKYPFADPREAKPTLTLGGEVHGGVKTNVVPGYYRFSLDRRLIPEETPEEAEEEIGEALEEARVRLKELGLDARAKIISKSRATVTGADSLIVSELSQAAADAVGERPSLYVCPGGLDTRYFQLAGIQAVTYGPGDSSYAHTADERNSLSEIMSVSKAYALLAARLLSSCG